MDLRDILVPGSRLSPRWILVLVRGLPESSRLVAEMRGGSEFRGWDAGRYATVAVVNAVRALTYTYVAANSKSRPSPPEPFPIPDKTVRQRSNNMFTMQAAEQLQRKPLEV